MATMDGIWAELLADGQAALTAKDPVKLGKVVEEMTALNKIQAEIDALKLEVDALSPPAIPSGQFVSS